MDWFGMFFSSLFFGYPGVDPYLDKEVAVLDDPVGETHRERVSKQKVPESLFRDFSKPEGMGVNERKGKTFSPNIKKWLKPQDIESLLKTNKNDFDPYLWTKDGKTWEDMYPFVRPDVGWWITKKLSDYTVKINYRTMYQEGYGSLSGTGWFLDFEEPENGKYPTKWFVATNAHVLKEYRFNSEGNYSSNIPKECIRTWWYAFECQVNKEMILYKDALMTDDWLSADRDPVSVWKNGSQGKPDLSIKKRMDRLIDASDKSTDPLDVSVNEHPFFGARVQSPKFTYLASKFMKPEKDNRDYILDMAIFEVEFKDELAARRMTNNLYDKYYKDGAQGTPLNFLNDDLDKEFNSKSKDKESYFSVGYPSNGLSPYRIMSNYSSESRIASLSKSKFIMCITCSSYRVDWGGKELSPSSKTRAYFISRMWSGFGASGSIVTDVYGNVLGIISGGRLERGEATVMPLRNYDTVLDTVNGKNKVFKPTEKAFDLITGIGEKDDSYKSIIVKNHLKTYLSKVNKWEENNSI